MSQNYSVETVRQIWNDGRGDRLEVGPDSDGLDLTEIRVRDSDGKITHAITMDNKQLELIIPLLQERLKEVQ